MGQPRRIRKKYSTPRHPWQKARIDEEKALRKEYGVKNKKEIWKMLAVLKSFTTQAKKLVIDTSAQGAHERENLLNRLRSYGLVAGDAGTDEILGLSIQTVMDRRLQTLVWKKGLANTVKQARQLITHKHIAVGGKKVSSPSYLVRLDEEPTISYASDAIATAIQTAKEEAAPVAPAPKQEEAPAQESEAPSAEAEPAAEEKSE